MAVNSGSATRELWPLVGRSTDVDRCLRWLTAERSVVIAGAAGVGKTRLARELADQLTGDRELIRLAAGVDAALPLSSLPAERDGIRSAIVALDDIQLLDPDAAAVIVRGVVDRRFTLLATMRTGEAHADPLTTLWKDDYAERIDLAPLERVEVDRLLDHVLGAPIEATARRTLWESTLGSPLMLRELVRSAIDDGTFHHDRGVWQLDGDLRSVRLDELIADRLDRLDPGARRAVELVAIGEPVGFVRLLESVGADALDAAEASGLIEAVTDGRRSEFRLGHPAFGDVTSRRLGAAATARHCAELRSLLESTPMRRRDDIVRSVTWQLRAGGTVMSADMVLAARRALYDRKELLAIDLASRALDDGGVAAGLILGVALGDQGDHERADRVLRSLADVGDDDVASRALVARQRADAMFWGLGRARETHDLLEAAEAAAPAGPWRDELRASRAVMMSNEGRIVEALELALPLCADATSGRPFVTAAVAATAALALAGRADEAKELAGVGHTACTELGDQLSMVDPGLFVVLAGMACYELGELDESAAICSMAYDVSVADGSRDGQAWCSVALARARLAQGRVTEAIDRCVEAAAVFESLHQPGPRRWALAGVVIGAALVGDSTRAEDAWTELQRAPTHPAAMMGPELRRAEAWAAVARGDRMRAIAVLDEAAEEAIAHGSRSLAAATLHDVIRLDGAVDRERWEAVEGCIGPLARARRALADAVSSHSAAGLASAADDFAAMGADVFAAECQQLAAEQFVRDGDRRSATRARRAASDAQNRTGEDWFVTLDRPASSGAIVDLTERERSIASLAAEGMTSRDIAEQLTISVRTVDNHLQRVYAKLGVSGRRDLAAALL